MKTLTYSIPFSITVFLSLIFPVQGELLVYEGFNYGLSDNTSINGTTTNATGLTGEYSVSVGGTGSSAAVANYRTSGLSFGSSYLSSSGGALNQRSYIGGSSVTGAQLDTSAVSGELWGSFLFRYDNVGGISTASYIRLNTGLNSGSATDWFTSSSDISGSSQQPAISYDGGTNTSSSSGYTQGTTYLMLSKFTNVSAALSGGSPGVASQWFLTQSGYENWLAAGGEEADLSTYATGTATSTATSGTYDFSDYLQYVAYSTSNPSASIFIDEVRYGTSMGDVIAIPEPSTFILLFGEMALLGLALHRRN